MPAPWALLEEFALNLEAVDEMCWSGPTDKMPYPALVLRTSPGPAFPLRVPENTAATITHAVREKATFTHAEVETFVFTPATAPAQPAALRPDPHPFTSGLKKFGW